MARATPDASPNLETHLPQRGRRGVKAVTSAIGGDDGTRTHDRLLAKQVTFGLTTR
jgi:hypothetical protein